MNRRRLRIKLTIIGCSILIFGFISAYGFYTHVPITVFKPQPYKSEGKEELGKPLTLSQVKEDAEQMIKIMETTHPIFLEGKTEKYKAAKAELINETNKAMTVADLALSISRYLTSIEDGHTRLAWRDTENLDVNWRYIDDKLLIVDGNGNITNKIVTRINGIETDKIAGIVMELFPAENYVAEELNMTKYSKLKTVLTYAGVNTAEDIILTVKNEDAEENMKVEFTSIKGVDKYSYEVSSKYLNDNTIYVKMGICLINDDLQAVVEALSEAVDKGVKNVIIDVRNNPGGNSGACTRILEALKMKPGHFGSIIRFSPLAQERYGYLRKSGYISFPRNNEAVKNENIKLYVITDEETFSSAQWMATWVSDGGLGTIVGRPSSNMPSSYGDVIAFQLDNSKISGQISYKKWTRPDKEKDNERVLEPDIYVDYSEDALSKTLEIIK